MKRKELTKTFMMISKWKKPFGLQGLYKNISALQGWKGHVCHFTKWHTRPFNTKMTQWLVWPSPCCPSAWGLCGCPGWSRSGCHPGRYYYPGWRRWRTWARGRLAGAHGGPAGRCSQRAGPQRPGYLATAAAGSPPHVPTWNKSNIGACYGLEVETPHRKLLTYTKVATVFLIYMAELV